MLDTDTRSYGKRSNDAGLKACQKNPDKRCVQVGHQQGGTVVWRRDFTRRRQDQTALEAFLHHVEVLDFPEEAASQYAKIRAERKVRGT